MVISFAHTTSALAEALPKCDRTGISTDETNEERNEKHITLTIIIIIVEKVRPCVLFASECLRRIVRRFSSLRFVTRNLNCCAHLSHCSRQCPMHCQQSFLYSFASNPSCCGVQCVVLRFSVCFGTSLRMKTQQVGDNFRLCVNLNMNVGRIDVVVCRNIFCLFALFGCDPLCGRAPTLITQSTHSFLHCRAQSFSFRLMRSFTRSWTTVYVLLFRRWLDFKLIFAAFVRTHFQ